MLERTYLVDRIFATEVTAADSRLMTCDCDNVSAVVITQWESGRPTLTPTNLEDKTEVKVDYRRQT